MGTRSVILVTGKERFGNYGTVRLYKHYDGYPTDNLEIIASVIEKAEREMENESVGHFSAYGFAFLIMAETASALDCPRAVIDKDDRGEAVYSEQVKPEHFGNQGDLEWAYLVDLENRTVKVWYLSRGYKPNRILFRKTSNPLSYASCLKPEYQAREKEEIKDAMTRVERAGWILNPKTKAA